MLYDPLREARIQMFRSHFVEDRNHHRDLCRRSKAWENEGHCFSFTCWSAVGVITFGLSAVKEHISILWCQLLCFYELSVDTVSWVCTLPVINAGGSLFNCFIALCLMSGFLRLTKMVVTKQFLENHIKVFFFATHLMVLLYVLPSLIVMWHVHRREHDNERISTVIVCLFVLLGPCPGYVLAKPYEFAWQSCRFDNTMYNPTLAITITNNLNRCVKFILLTLLVPHKIKAHAARKLSHVWHEYDIQTFIKVVPAIVLREKQNNQTLWSVVQLKCLQMDC